MTPFTQGTVEDRIACRLRALRLARRRGNTREGAWAASRVRLPGVSLEPADSRFARDARVRFGRALRIARLRRGDEATAETAVAPPLARKRSRTARLAVLAVALALFATTLLLIWTPFNNDDQAAGGGRPLAGGVAPTASPLRGRSDQVVAVVPVQTATPVPDVTDEPSATPAATTAPAGQSAGSTGNTGGGGSGGGSGGGKGTGTGSGTGTATPAPTPTPSPVPTPAPTEDPSTTMILRGRVVDARSGTGLPAVCVAPGLNTCVGQTVTYTDSAGFWELHLSVGQNWDIKFLKSRYLTAEINVPSQPGIHYVPDIRLRPTS